MTRAPARTCLKTNFNIVNLIVILMQKIIALVFALIFSSVANAYDPMDCVNDAVKVYPEFTNGLVTRLCSAATNAEPAKCFRDISNVDNTITVGISVDVCSGTSNAVKTIECYGKAWSGGLNRGQAKRLCSGSSSLEPIKCYANISKVDKDITVGIAVDVCASSLNADRTIGCYAKAASTMNRGLATTLCSPKGRQQE